MFGVLKDEAFYSHDIMAITVGHSHFVNVKDFNIHHIHASACDKDLSSYSVTEIE